MRIKYKIGDMKGSIINIKAMIINIVNSPKPTKKTCNYVTKELQNFVSILGFSYNVSCTFMFVDTTTDLIESLVKIDNFI